MKIYRHGTAAAKERQQRIGKRGQDYTKKMRHTVEAIIAAVRKNGDQALENYSRQFDAPKISARAFRVTPKEMDSAAKAVDKPFVRALNRAIRQVSAFHRSQLQATWLKNERPGVLLGQLVRPVDSAGIYVPGAQGGETPLVSTVVMGTIPAKIAGVPKVVMVTPPRKDGRVAPHLLVAAKKAGVDEIYKIGSAWAIAALAFGTETIPRVDMIAGPGNIYVALAKKILAETVGIDMIAGPSEILIIGDASADPRFVAADLLSQAEHDRLSSAILVTCSENLARETMTEIEKQLSALPRQETARQALAAYGAIFVVKNLHAAFDLANSFAPEHLELQIDSPLDWLGQVRHAGAVFLGHYTPEPVGDYVAGPNHTLPTAGSARFASALGTANFLKKISMVHYSRAAFQTEAADVIQLAEVEGLTAHAEAVRIRRESKK